MKIREIIVENDSKINLLQGIKQSVPGDLMRDDISYKNATDFGKSMIKLGDEKSEVYWPNEPPHEDYELLAAGYASRIWKMIEESCGKNIASMRPGGFLFRGRKQANLYVFKGSTPTNRNPVDTGSNIQSIVDNFLRLADFTALRSNSIFVTGDYEQASYYGDFYAVFPFDDAAITWNKKIKDLFTYMIHNELIDLIRPDSFVNDDYHDIIQWYESNPGEAKIKASQAGFVNGNLREAIISNKEIYISGDYYAINYDRSSIHTDSIQAECLQWLRKLIVNQIGTKL